MLIFLVLSGLVLVEPAQTGQSWIDASAYSRQVEQAQAVTMLRREGQALQVERVPVKSEGRETQQEKVTRLRVDAELNFLLDPKASKKAYEQLLEISPYDLEARGMYGQLLSRMGDLAGAEAAFNLVLKRAGGNKEIEAATLTNLAIVAQARGQLDVAEDYQKRALVLAEELGNKEGIATALANLGNTAILREDYNKAEDYLKRALALQEEMNNEEGLASTLVSLSNLTRMRGDLAAAEAYLNRSLPIFEAAGYKQGVGVVLGNLGGLAMKRGDLDKAEELQKRALTLHEETGNKEGMAGTLSNLGYVSKDKGDKTGARKYFKRALAVYEDMGQGQGEDATQIRNELKELGAK